MKVEYESNNGWRICSQDDLFSSDTSWFSIHRYYPSEKKWVPFKLIGDSLSECFLWLWRCNFISHDEMKHQLSKLV